MGFRAGNCKLQKQFFNETPILQYLSNMPIGEVCMPLVAEADGAWGQEAVSFCSQLISSLKLAVFSSHQGPMFDQLCSSYFKPD